MLGPQEHSPTGNRLLDALPQNDFARLGDNLEPVQLPKGAIIYNAGDVVRHMYFIGDGQISLLSTTSSGATIEVAMIGNEGVVGIPGFLPGYTSPYSVMVQIEVKRAWKIRIAALKEEFIREGKLQELLLRYIHALITQISQSAVCNRFHSSEQRLARWFLTSSDIVKSDVFFLTHEFIAHMLGTPRTGVTMAAGVLQREGLIHYSRGKITIRNRKGLESFSCECYKTIKNELARITEM